MLALANEAANLNLVRGQDLLHRLMELGAINSSGHWPPSEKDKRMIAGSARISGPRVNSTGIGAHSGNTGLEDAPPS